MDASRIATLGAVKAPRRVWGRVLAGRTLPGAWAALLTAGILTGVIGCFLPPASVAAGAGMRQLTSSLSVAVGSGREAGAGAGASTSADPAAPALPAWTSAHCYGGSLVVVAHADDDLLFVNPEQQRAISAGTCVYTVYVTAGDAGRPAGYWQARERGAQAAYAYMAKAPDEWVESTITSRGLRLMTLKADFRVNLVFMRLPDGMQRGVGAKPNRYQSLKKLWTGAISRVAAVDGSTTYTRSQLTKTLTELMAVTRPGVVRTLDYVGTFSDTDHADHHAVAYLTRQASKQYKQRHSLVSYQGYPIASKTANLPAAEAQAKLAAFDIYAAHDAVAQNRTYITRQYVVAGR